MGALEITWHGNFRPTKIRTDLGIGWGYDTIISLLLWRQNERLSPGKETCDNA